MKNTLKIFGALAIVSIVGGTALQAQAKFARDFSPAEGLTAFAESQFRREICLNGLWEFQPVDIPQGYRYNLGTPPPLADARDDKWESVKIKIPSPWNVNNWGGGQRTGEGTNQPYAPSSVYYPSYPESWAGKRMGWLRRDFEVPADWKSQRIFLHFDAVAGENALYVNGKHVVTNMTQQMGFRADITDFVKPGKNEVKLGIRHVKLFDKDEEPEKSDGDKSRKYFVGMRSMFPAGSNSDDLIGIWQDVFLLAVPQIHVSDVYVKPLVGKDTLEIEVTITNPTSTNFTGEVSGIVREWINTNPALARANTLNLDDGKPLGDRLKTVLDAAEISWKLSDDIALKIPVQKISVKAGESASVTIKTKVGGRLKHWSPDAPNLYGALIQLAGADTQNDVKYTRFGWREFTFDGYDFLLNGKKIQAFGDIQHPFGPYVCSRRFAFAWYQMIKNFGGNAVRPHAQVWPKYYYDLADEMGIMVLCENGLFGSSIRPNMTQEGMWQNTFAQTERMVKRYRNNPSVIGWSVGNEMFALSLKHLASIPAEEKEQWDAKLVELANFAKKLDPTRPFTTVDGDDDLGGRLPVWSKHFADGYRSGHIEKIKRELNTPKPLVIGEFGATYYGMPPRVWKYAGDKVFESYAGRNEALAVDLYKNVVEMIKPHVAYFSPSEVCWFGIEHLNYGYHDFARLPAQNDGIFPAKKYEEGKPGYQFERIPPYVFTVNPGVDEKLPFFRPLAHYNALKAALAGKPCEWDEYKILDGKHEERPFEKAPPIPLPNAKFTEAFFVGDINGTLANQLRKFGVVLTDKNSNYGFVIVDGENLDAKSAAQLKGKIIPALSKTADGVLLVMTAENEPSDATKSVLGKQLDTFRHDTTSMAKGDTKTIADHFNIPDLYFVYGNREDRQILKTSFGGDWMKDAKTIFKPASVNWDLFDAAEKTKCAQVVLYEHLEKRFGAGLAAKPMGKSTFYLSALNYNVNSKEGATFFKHLFRAMGLGVAKGEVNFGDSDKLHDLLMDGPMD